MQDIISIVLRLNNNRWGWGYFHPVMHYDGRD